MSKIDVVRKAMTDALKAGDKPRKEALSLLLAALKNKWIDKREDLTEDEENAVVYKEIKEAQETLDTTPADRTDIREEARFRMEVWSTFASERMGEDEVRALVAAVAQELGGGLTVKDKGRLMKALMPRLKGKAEGGLVNRVVDAMLG
ncbi:MAG: GatB/YqeY domain-containing protein [Candidatus Limiplasma sp.]|nr:GatB/YqeY domain-containing protein [Candidatus Limiplasma sp.]